jgi:AraC-like DNA-binding protein
MDEFLLQRLERGPRPSPEVGWAWRRLVATAGAAPISGIANDVGWSHKHLITMFRRQVGLSPKTAARLVRFEGVSRLVEGAPRVDWGQVAADAGYADQAHLIREFRQFTGTTPTGYLAQLHQHEVNSVQAAAPVPA